MSNSDRNQKEIRRVGPGFLSCLLLLFIGLKLTGHIAWSWLWVLAPALIPLAVVLLAAAVVGISAIVLHRLEERERKERQARRSK